MSNPNTGNSSSAFIHTSEVNGFSDVEREPCPLAKEDVTSEELHKKPHLRIRMPYFALLARFRSGVVSALTKSFDTHPDGSFYQVHLPITTWTDCEGGN